jgi:hypothetical protein
MAEKKINGRTFKAEPMLATDALVLQARLFKALGPAVQHFGAIMRGHGEDKTEEQKAQSNAAAIGALASVFAQSQPQEIAGIIKDLVETCQIKRDSGNYDPCDFDGDFTGNQKDIMPVVLFALQEQFGDFFAGVPGIGNLGKALKA